MKYQIYTLCLLLIIVYSCNKPKTENTTEPENLAQVITIDTLQGKSLMGENLISPQVNFTEDSIQIKNYKAALDNYKKDSSSIDNIIWLGRRIAYLGDYKKAISIFTEGIKLHPNEPRLYRHRGHRYISLRKFDEAINDLSKAAELIEGKEDIVEQDGIPNRLNQPVSTLHTNIYYHLGLAYYLQNDLVKAEEIFRKCLEASKNDDMQVATRHWLYMILKLQDKDEAAKKILEPVTPEMNIIENDAYHQLLLFYKG
ncbi:MAG: tetratricopeptide repeat protein, partial [Flavobacteriaceae bacterium]|nr:tetratricopeptide repeat protein [Flavobacteriaceae bacterium]